MLIKAYCRECDEWKEFEHDPKLPITERHTCGHPYSMRHGEQPTSSRTWKPVKIKK